MCNTMHSSVYEAVEVVSPIKTTHPKNKCRTQLANMGFDDFLDHS